MEEAKTADAVQAADLYRYAQHISIMQNDEELYTQGLHYLLQGDAASNIISIINQYRNKKILVVAHAGVIQALTSYYLFGNLDGYWKFKINNGSITKLHVMEDGYTYFEYINLT